MGDKKSFLKIGVMYTIGQIMLKVISFVMIPVYTKILGVAGFGELAIVDTVLNFSSTFLILTIYSGYIRFYRDYEENEREKLRNTAINFALIMAIISIVFTIVIGKFIAPTIFDFGEPHKIFISVIVRGLIDQITVLLMCDYSLNYEADKMVLINFFIMILDIVFILTFLYFFKDKILAIYVGYIIGSGIMLIYLILKQIGRYKLEFDLKMFKKMIKFSAGLVPCNISAAVLDLADRYFLAGYKGFADTGIYSMGYKIGMLIQPLFISPFQSIFTPYKFEIWKEKNNEKKFNVMFRNYHLIGCLFIIGISIYSKLLILILSNKEYIIACNLIPIILFSYFINGENEFFSLGIQLRNKTYVTSFIMLIGGISNILLNILLIPRIGMYGAAIATLISYFIINMVNGIISKKLYHVKFDFKTAYKIDFLAILICLIHIGLGMILKNILTQILIGNILILGYIVIIIKLKLVDYIQLKELIISKIKR